VEEGGQPVFDTPSGKVEFWSDQRAAKGHDAVPEYTRATRCRPQAACTRRRAARQRGVVQALRILAMAHAIAAVRALPARPMAPRSGASNCRFYIG
jgi:hypothetical protein